MTNEPTPKIRRWFQFSLRTLLVLMVVVGLGMGWVMKERRGIAKRREGLKSANLRILKGSEQPTWHKWLFGDDRPGYAQDICVSTRDLTHLKELKQVQALFVTGEKVTDAEMAHIKGLSQLKWLNLRNTQVTDAGLVHLKELSQLQTLYLSGTQITDAGLPHLKGLTQLNVIRLAANQVTDSGIADLQAALPNCTIYR